MSHLRVKICGLTNLDDARCAAEAGADLLGFIFFAKSPRSVTPEVVAAIIPQVRVINPNQVTVGVVVNERAEQIAAIMAQTGLDAAQLHGDETPAWFPMLNGCCYKALRPANDAEATAQAATFASLNTTVPLNTVPLNTTPLHSMDRPHWMIDAYDPDAYGGTGKHANWLIATKLARQYPGLLLAGGLTPKNVAQAIHVVQPWGVDVASGVEAEPGRKDPAKVWAFVDAVRTVSS